MKTLKQFVNQFSVDVMGCPNPLAERIVREAAIDICERTQLLRKKNLYISITADESEYTIPVDDDYYSVHGLFKVNKGELSDEKYLPITDEHNLTQRYGDGWKYMTGNTPVSVFLTPEKKLRIFPIPTVDFDDDLILEVVVKPTQAASKVDDILYNDYLQLIADYCRWHLMAIPSQVWSNENLAAYYQTQYKSKLNEINIRIFKSHGNKSLRVKYRKFG